MKCSNRNDLFHIKICSLYAQQFALCSSRVADLLTYKETNLINYGGHYQAKSC